MNTKTTIRNCPTKFRFQCPQLWDKLLRTELPDIRHCTECNRDVYFCTTDEATIEHAMAGHCIARELPGEDDLRTVVLGTPAIPIVPTPEQLKADVWFRRERGIDDSIKNADSERSCPQCKYPAPKWRVDCRVCGFEMGRVVENKTTPTDAISDDK